MACNILDSKFRYTPAIATDLKKKFAQVRKRQDADAKRKAAVDAETANKVRKIVVAR